MTSMACFYAMFFFFWVEEKHETITFDEFFDDYLNTLDSDLSEEMEKMFKHDGEIRSSYEESGRELPPEFLTYTDTDAKSNDFDASRDMSLWDTPYSEFLTEVMEHAHSEWNYIGDTESEAGVGLTLDELEYQYLLFFKRGRNDPDYKAISNKHLMAHSYKLANSGIMVKAFHCNSQLLQENPVPNDIRSFLYHKDDFRTRYWRSLAQRKLLNKNL